MSIATHLPALQVVLPLLAAPLTVLLRRPGLAFLVAVAASWCALAMALAQQGDREQRKVRVLSQKVGEAF